ncbi:MAG: hypothetical protein K0S36_1547 [Nitrosospira multiformis]|jgi:hypothetical protein|nr:hypothetical protein [Nitrosospira multiformis]
MIEQSLGRSPAATFATINGEKIRRVFRTPAIHCVAQFVNKVPPADGSLDTHGSAGEIADMSDLVEQFIHIPDIAMTIRAD